ncbi:MAG: universal stress protein, partial [Planctomycetota bacterium]|nr:universal stress protein [Planctomycetota bacterium]
MKRFKNILLYLHGEHENDASLERAAALASENNAALKVVEVQEYSTSHATSGGGEMAWDRHFLERTEYLDRAIAPIRDQGISVSAQVLLGTPFVEVIRLVQRFGYDLVMTTAEGQGGLREALFGTTTTKLLRKCPCPVWVIKATHGKQYRCVLAAVTPCPGEETEKAALN